jgi:circadian clock protein KaiB
MNLKPAPRVYDIAPRLRVRLYIAGESPNSVAARANLRAALQPYPEHQVELEIIDVLSDPERGVQDKVLVTPMLVKVEPLPARRLLGNLSSRAALLGVLGLEDEEEPHD